MNKTILVVEDQEDNRQILRDLLASSGFLMIEAHDGEQALAMARSQRPDLILMDIQLPVVDGYEGATRSIKRGPELKHIPVIAVTCICAKRRRGASARSRLRRLCRQALQHSPSAGEDRPVSRTASVSRSVHDPPRVLIVDDNENNRAILAARLGAEGYSTEEACDGAEALEVARRDAPDLILLDVTMPRMDGLEACRRLRSDPSVGFVPIILVTARAESKDVVAGLEAGADEYLTKPVDQQALLARVRSMLRVKELHDRTKQQAAELAAWNDALERRVAEQVIQIERANRLKRFLPPQVADLVQASPTMEALESHRREITVVFCDLRGFTAFAEVAEPEEVMAVLKEYHSALGELIHEFEGTLERFVGDGLLVLFNDPIPCSDPCLRAGRMAAAMRARLAELAGRWRASGHSLGFGVGIAHGYATLGTIGFEGRSDYSAIGTVVNLAARLCAEAGDGHILVDSKVRAAIERAATLEPAGDLVLKGLHRVVPAFHLNAIA